MARRLEFEFDLELTGNTQQSQSQSQSLNIVIVSHVLSHEIGEFVCPVCYDTIENAKRMTISCNHTFCASCTTSLLKTCHQENKNATCPMCRYSCFLIETPDVSQFSEMAEVLECIENARKESKEYAAFLHWHTQM